MKKTDSSRGLLNQELEAVEWSQRDTLTVLRAAENGGRTVVKKKMTWALAMVLILMLLTTGALALVGHGLEWYYDNRFPARKENQPEKYEAIMANLQADVPQWMQEDSEVCIAVTEVSWASEEQMLVVSVMAEAADPAVHELHPMWNLDADGAYVGDGGAAEPMSDGEDRAVHWLWTNGGFGPVEQMVAPGKALLLMDTQNLYLGDMCLRASMDAYVTEAGMVHTVLESRLDTAQMEALLAADTDGDGFVTLTLPYTITSYTTDDALLYGGGRTGEIHFEVKIH